MKDLEKKVVMAGAGKITKFFERVDEPLLGRPRKVVVVIDDDGGAFQNGHNVSVMDIAFSNLLLTLLRGTLDGRTQLF